MTVDELRKILQRVRGDLRVEITLPDDEFPATCVTVDRHYLRICRDDAEISHGETVLHNDKAELET